jgi:hypothetical protein
MQSLRSVACWIARTAAALSIGLLAAPAVWAADAEPPSGQSYVKSYMLVLLVCALGLIVVCRSANRTTEIKFFDDE